MSSETPGGGLTSPTSGSHTSTMSSMPRTLTMSDEITIYEIKAPIPSKPTLKPLTFEVLSHEPFFKSSPIRMSPQKLLPLNSGSNQSPKILSPSTLSILSPMRENQSSCDQLPQFVHSPSSQHVLLIPSKPELTVTVVSSPTQSESSLAQTHVSTLVSPVQVLPIPHVMVTEPPNLEQDMENTISSSKVIELEEEKSTVRKRQRRVCMPQPQKTIYNTRTVVKASRAAQNEKDELACQKVKIEVPSVKPSSRAIDMSLPPPILPTYRSGRKRTQRKLSTAEQLQQLREDRSIDLENPGSLLKLINLKNVLTKHTFSRLPLEDQSRLLHLLPDVDTISEVGKPDQPCEDAFDNLFYNKACEDWKAKLMAGDFTPEQKQKQKQETERDMAKVDPWKKKHFEPIWGFNDVKRVLRRPVVETPAPTSTITKPEVPLPLLISQSPNQEAQSAEKSSVPPEPVVLDEKVIVEESPPAPTQTPPQILVPLMHSPPTPGKRDSTHLTEEAPILSKRIRRVTPNPPPETEAPIIEVIEDVVDSKQEEQDYSIGPLEMIQELEEDEELNKTPIPAADNEVTIENSPYEEPSAPSSSPEEEPDEEFVLQAVTIDDDKCPEDFSEEVYIETTPAQVINETLLNGQSVKSPLETVQPETQTVHELSEVTEQQVATQEEVMSENRSVEMYDVEEQIQEEFVQQQLILDQIQNSSLQEDATINLEEVEIENSVAVRKTSFQEVQSASLQEAQIANLQEGQTVNLQEAQIVNSQEAQTANTQGQIVNLQEGQPMNFQEGQTLNLQEGQSMKMDDVETPDLEVIATHSQPEPIRAENFVPVESIVTNTSTSQNQLTINDIIVSSPSPKSVPLSPIITIPMSQGNIVMPDRSAQPVILRMVSMPSSHGSLHTPAPSSVHSAPTQQPVTSLQPIVLKPIVGGTKVDPIKNLVPKVLSDFIPVQPRTFIGLPPAEGGGGKVQQPAGQQHSASPLTKMNGPAVLGGVQSPGSPGNAKPKPSTVPPGSVNLDRSYQICNAVIQNSPNREQLQKQLVKPPPLTPNNRIVRPDMGNVDSPTAVIQMSRRASTPTLIQSNVGQIQMAGGVNPGQKVMLVNHQGMAPLIRPIQQHQSQTPNHHQIIVSTPSSSNGMGGQRALGMNVTFTTKHNPTTNSNQSATLTSTSNTITPHQLALLLRQQHTANNQQRAQTPIMAQTQQRQQLQLHQRPSLFISRPVQAQQLPQVKILNSSQFHSQSRIVQPQILQFQSQSQRTSSQIPQDGMQFPIRAQIMTPNGETLTIHRAGGVQPIRVSSPIRSTNQMSHNISGEQPGKGAGLSPSVTPPLAIINRTFPDNCVQSIVTNSQGNDSGASSHLSPAQNLADFITNQWTASNIRPISPLAFDSGGDNRLILGRTPSTTPTNKSRDSHQTNLHLTNSPNTGPQNPSHQNQSSEMFMANHQRSHSNAHQQQLGFTELISQGTLLDLQDGGDSNSGGGGQFSVIKQHKSSESQFEFIHIDRGGGPSLHPNSSPNGSHNFSRSVIDGGSLVQNSRVDCQGAEGLQPQQTYVLVQTTGSNGMPQNLVLQASLVMPPQIKEEAKVGDVGPPRAASAPPTNQTMIIGQQQQQPQQSNCNPQENKHISLPVNFQDFSGLRVVYKDEMVGNEESRRMEYCVSNAPPSSYTLTPVSSAGTQDIVRVMNRNSTGSPEVCWNYNSVPSSGHIVNVNLNGSNGSARIIPGQHPVISIPDTTNGSSSCSGMSSDFDLFSAIASTGSESLKIENNGDTRSILIPVPMTNNNRQHFQPRVAPHGQQVSAGLPSSHGNCVCDLRAMTPCRKCGAYSHTDCMKSGLELCMGCVIR